MSTRWLVREVAGLVVVIVAAVVVLVGALGILGWRAAREWPEDPEQDARTQPDHYMD